MPFCLLDTGVGGHIEILIFAGYEFISGYVCIAVSEFCVDGAFTAGEETECCPFWSCWLNSSADSDFDGHVMGLWRNHLKETGRSCGKNSNHWKSLFAELDLSPDVDVDGEVLVAEVE